MNNAAETPSQQAMADEFLIHLRAETDELHKEVEAHPTMLALMSPNVSRKDYSVYLELMQQVVAGYEADVLPVLAGILMPVERYKMLPAINSDIERLSSGNQQFHFSKTVPKWDTPESKSNALGCAYVMEGSRLGGRVILKHIQKTLGYTPASGASFLAGHGEDTGRHWKTFLSTFTTYVVNQSGSSEAIAGATRAFNNIHTHLRQYNGI